MKNIYNSSFIKITITCLLLLSFMYVKAEIDITNVTHTSNGLCNGEIEITAFGTAGPFKLTLSLDESGPNTIIEVVEDFQGSYTFSNLCVDDYEIKVENSFGCITTLYESVLVCENFEIQILGEITNVCFNNDGEIQLTVSGGTDDDYTYLWSNFEETQNVSGLSEGNYSVTVTDGGGCIAEESFDVGSNVDPNFAIQLNSIGCFCPGGFGTIDITITGNSGPYTFLWTGGEVVSPSAEDAEALEVGSYHVDVMNAYGCVINQDFNLEACNFDFDDFNIYTTNSCEGPNTGNILIETSVIGVTAQDPYYFAWETIDGDLVAGTGQTAGYDEIDDLAPGEYCVTITSGNGCEASSCGLVISEYPDPEISYVITPASSETAADGAIDLEAPGAGEPVFYSWSTGANTEDISGLVPGTYSVWISFEGGACDVQLEFEVVYCGSFFTNLEVSGEVTPMSFAGNDGAIDLTLEGGDGYEFEFQWYVPLPVVDDFNSTDEDIEGLEPNNYCVLITHPACNNFSILRCFEICSFEFELRTFGSGTCDGTSLIALTDGGNSPHTFQWSNGALEQSITAGYNQEYCVTVTDKTGCTARRCTTIELPEMELSFEVTNSPFGTSSGSITANVANDLFPPLTYTWNNGMTGQTIPGLPAGQYCVTVTDNCGKEVMGCAVVACEITSNSVNAVITNFACGESGTGGAINITVSLDFGLYTYLWSNGATTEDISDLFAGEYCVDITHHPSGCIYSNCYTVGVDGNGSFDIGFETQPSCHGGTGGSITANVSGGIEDYTYVWTIWNPLTGIEEVGYNQTLDGIGSGWYTVHVTDATGCTDANYTLFWPTEPSIDYDIEVSESVVCEGETANASITNIAGGTAPYSIEWRKLYLVIETGPTVMDLEPDWYYVTVTDADGCRREKAFQVVQAADIAFEATITNTCGTSQSGSIEIDYTGDYSFEWSNGMTSANIQNLNSGSYSVTITDVYGCSKEDSYTIGFDYLAVYVTSIEDNICIGDCIGRIDIKVNSSNPITYNWSNGATTQDLDGLCSGDYMVTVTSGECTSTNTYTVSGGEQDFEFEVEVIRHFNYGNSSNGKAALWIYSDIFENGGHINFSAVIGSEEISYTTDTNQGEAYIVLPFSFSVVNPLFFTYTAPNGCEYEGSFEGIPTCVPESPLNFGVIHVGDNEEFCGVGQQHSYIIHLLGVKENPPYSIKVTMDEAAYESESEYEQIVEYIGPNTFQIDGIPAGTIRFEVITKCSNNPIFVERHTNCCPELSCDIIREHPIQVGDDPDYVYTFQYFTLWANELCYDGTCGGVFDDPCSTISIKPYGLSYFCWDGLITITYPDNSTVVLEVTDNGDYSTSHIVSGEDNWKPNGPGIYPVGINYEGTGSSQGQDCETEVDVNFYGTANYGEAIVFRDDYWFPNDWYPQGSMDAYYGASTCQICGTGGEYLFDRNDCSEEFNYSFTYFNFQPINPDPELACNSGGVLTIMEFDDNGVATIQDVVLVPPYTAIESFPGLQAFNAPEGEWCLNSGWCHFDGDAIYGFNKFNGRPILATWYDPVSCVDDDDPVIPPCNDLTNPCLFGECVDGNCEVQEDDCFPLCPDGYDCVGNECVLQDGELTCVDACDCPIGQTCNGSGNCVALPFGQECSIVDGGGDCQCPENYICDNGQCEFNVACNECDPGIEYCKNNQCTPCPDLSVSFCYKDSNCGITTDCILEIELVSSIGMNVANIEVFRNGVSMGVQNLSINHIRKLYPVVPCGGQGYFYQVVVSFNDCTYETFDAPFQAICGDACFDEGSGSNNFSNNTTIIIDDGHELKTDEELNASYPTIIKAENISASKCIVYPNPFGDIINVEYLAEESAFIDIVISDIYGRQIQKESVEVFSGKNETQVKLKTNIPTGVYFILITNEKGEREIFRLLHTDL